MYYLSRLRDLRQDHDLKQKEVAALLKIDHTSLVYPKNCISVIGQ